VLTVVNPEEPVPAAVSVPVVSGGSLIDEIVRDGARRMLAAAALAAEVAAYIAAHASELDEGGGLSSQDFAPALQQFLGTGSGLSAATITRLTVHLRTTNPIESTFATVRHRTKVTKGPGSKAGLTMAFKLIEAAQRRWRAVNAPHLVALVRAGARFEHGHLIGRRQATAA
jgi:hypothetical protein